MIVQIIGRHRLRRADQAQDGTFTVAFSLLLLPPGDPVLLGVGQRGRREGDLW